ncbi:hypothetical protein [Pyrobaculum aerophilum]|uniref:Peptidase S1 domain-containing protein n=1 Tax=Pyrobaculum aerophilum TaxID=13773 RepID=A0A371R1H2_9CREN|nr:hypothetical protein [Pyrobaculum aerophilum]RFA96880.1 hypothetical protein CGL51_04175 [Pyrobaculum aerophilum]RFA97401.1 hypothetical protein CGL52_09415 [Pyrobaculum aerophilum]
MERRIVLGLALAAVAMFMFSATYPDQKFRPLVAGVQYEARWGLFELFGSICSLGYPVALSSSPSQPWGYVSASHCIESRVGVNIYQPTKGSDTYIGTSRADKISVSVDAYAIDVSDKSIISNKVISLPSGATYTILKYYTDSELSGIIGSTLCKTGRSTLTTCGIFTHFNAGDGWVVTSDPPWCDSRPVIMAEGDSGGVVWYFYGSGAAVAGMAYKMDTGKCCRYFTGWDGQQYYGCDNFFFRSADTINKALGVVGWK